MSHNGRIDGLRPGSRVCGYEVLGQMGSGAFGITYRCLHAQTGGHFVLKEYFPANLAARDRQDLVRANPQTGEWFSKGLGSFHREAEILSRLRHPNVVQVTEKFEANDTAYYAMPHVEGETLHTLINRSCGASRQPSRETLNDIFIPLLEGLKYLHAHRVIHRDLKPENVLITQAGIPVLIDFGSARYMLGQISISAHLAISPAYAPLELYASSGNITPAADLYSLAATLYTAITCSVAVEAPMRVAAASDPQKPLAGSAYEKHYGRSFLQAVDKGMALLPADRFQDAFAMQMALMAGVLGENARD